MVCDKNITTYAIQFTHVYCAAIAKPGNQMVRISNPCPLPLTFINGTPYHNQHWMVIEIQF